MDDLRYEYQSADITNLDKLAKMGWRVVPASIGSCGGEWLMERPLHRFRKCAKVDCQNHICTEKKPYGGVCSQGHDPYNDLFCSKECAGAV